MKNTEFNNTETAFAWKSDKDLKRAISLLRLIGNRTLVKIGTFFTNTAIKIKFPINWAVRPTIYQHFVGGETLQSCDEIINKFAKYNVKAVLDFSVEGGETEQKINEALEETLRTIDNAAKNPNIPFAVFKPTAFCINKVLEKAGKKEKLNEQEQNEINQFKKRVRTLCQHAYDLDVPIMIDAEDHIFQEFVDETVYEMMLEFNKQKAIVYNTLQMYRKDRLDFLKKLHKDATNDKIFVGVKFVRGAYMERERTLAKKHGYPDPIHPNKDATDDAYNDALKFSVENLNIFSIFNATHNEFSSHYFLQLLHKHNIKKDDPRCFSAQLYGMSDNITFNLAKSGYNAAKYTPYGPIKHVLPYILRRAEENTSVSGQTSRELSLLLSEKKRRKNNK